MKSRLLKNNIMTKQASFYMPLDSMVLKSGDIIDFEAKILANKPWFQINQSSNFNTSSYYDGNDFDRACDIYTELLLAFKGASKAEQFSKTKNGLKDKIEKLEKERVQNRHEDMYDALKRKPLFLGLNDF